ncbi:MAG: HAMP domain-containing sensor histidine kinase [Leptolyngbyaceae cyanobacterium MO_188.B28]|nr:HAMP domain-containing sensor histidine kinase [Leptolyngbyaceae cyanobacterium MO_188.B28]
MPPTLEDQESASTCRIFVGLAAEPSNVPQLALVQLLEHIRSGLILLLSYELQTPLSTIQTAVETLADGAAMPAQAQRSLLDLALSELNQLCHSVEGRLAYATQLWSMTLDFAQFGSDQATTVYLNSIFTALPEATEGYQPWMETTRTLLTLFLQVIEDESNDAPKTIPPQQIALLDQGRRNVLAIVNHELRTPFTTLQVCLETLQSEVEPSIDTRQALLEVACEDLKRLCVLVRDLELLCRLEARQVYFQTEWVDLGATLQATLSSFLEQTSENVLSNIWIESAADLSPIWADGDRLVEVTQRLLENACRFTATTGEVKVNVEIASADGDEGCAQSAAEASTLIICISDTGRGISSEQLERIFDCFHQEEGYLQRTTGGIGIGLTICRCLIEGMGGQIWAESSGKQQGSRFCFTLPVYRESETLF